MNRYLDRHDERKQENSDSSPAISRTGGEAGRSKASGQSDESISFGDNRRERFALRDQSISIKPSELASLSALARFRVIREEDLRRGVYGNDSKLADADLRSLQRKHLIQAVTYRKLLGAQHRIYTISEKGHDLLRLRDDDPGTARSPDMMKPAECMHDSLLYRAYLNERGQIHRAGGRVRKLTFENDLKREYFRRLNGRGSKPYYETQKESARELHLPVVDGHVLMPDLRVEYEDERGELGRVDVEVATENYRGHHLQSKIAAGFQVHREASRSGGLTVKSGSVPGAPYFQENPRVHVL